ncbi:MAG TPA: sensor histidine kinase [Candidatus Acidoferrum sp.]|nr:sensor histidine kinase [Candidatus Acidoferrum sp.]
MGFAGSLQAAQRGASPVAANNPSHRRLRVVLLVCFGGLLIFPFYSGASALKTLRRLQQVEELARRKSLQRERVLSTVILSANVYTDHMEQFLLGAEEAPDTSDEVSQRADAARAALQSYPADRSAEEDALIRQLQDCLAKQDSVIRSSREWKPEERRVRAQQAISEKVIPGRQQFVEVAQQVELLNDSQVLAAEQGTFRQFDRLQGRLTSMLILSLSSGLIVAIGGAIYILRLERQADLRYAELARSRYELQELSTRLVDAQETERRSISRELHDEVGQALGLLLLDAGRLSKQMGKDVNSQEIVQRIKTLAERTLQEVRNIALLLRPSMLDDLGLVAAVEWFAREMSRRGETEVEVRADNIKDDLSDDLKLCVYRVVQEALNNVQRHAHAKNVSVDLSQNDGVMRVKIADDGAGFDAQRTRGMGLLGMDERVKRLGGQLKVGSRQGLGTTIEAELPVTGKGTWSTNEKNQSSAG